MSSINRNLSVIRDVGIMIIAIVTIVAVVQNYETLVKVDNNREASEKRDNKTLSEIKFAQNITIENQHLILQALGQINNATEQLASNPQSTAEEQRELFDNVTQSLRNQVTLDNKLELLMQIHSNESLMHYRETANRSKP